MIYGASQGNVAAMKELLNKSSSSSTTRQSGSGSHLSGSAPPALYVKDKRGLTPLHAAAARGHLKTAKWIAANGGSGLFRDRDNEGSTALHLACSGQHLDLVKWLVESQKMDVNDKDDFGWTCLHWAAYRLQQNLFDWLIDVAKADVTATDKRDWTCLHYATYRNYNKAAQFVARCGNDAPKTRQLRQEVESYRDPIPEREVPAFVPNLEEFPMPLPSASSSTQASLAHTVPGTSHHNLPSLPLSASPPNSFVEKPHTSPPSRRDKQDNKDKDSKDKDKDKDDKERSGFRKKPARSSGGGSLSGRSSAESPTTIANKDKLERIEREPSDDGNQDENVQSLIRTKRELERKNRSLKRRMREREKEQEKVEKMEKEVRQRERAVEMRLEELEQEKKRQEEGARKSSEEAERLREKLAKEEKERLSLKRKLENLEKAKKQLEDSGSNAKPLKKTSDNNDKDKGKDEPEKLKRGGSMRSMGSGIGRENRSKSEAIGHPSLSLSSESADMNVDSSASSTIDDIPSKPPGTPVLGSQRMHNIVGGSNSPSSSASRVPTSVIATSPPKSIPSGFIRRSTTHNDGVMRDNGFGESVNGEALGLGLNCSRERSVSFNVTKDIDMHKTAREKELEEELQRYKDHVFQLQDSLQKHQTQAKQQHEMVQSLNEKLGRLQNSTDKDWEINMKEVTLVKQIGKGNFGEVWKGEWRGCTVAVKKVAHSALYVNAEQFRQEANIMKELRPHHFTLQFLGYCAEPENACIVTEYLPLGNLLHHLRKLKKEKGIQALDSPTLARLAMEIAAGMSHLHAEEFLHRDLACRNILLKRDGAGLIHPVISDFGLSRQMKVYVPNIAYGPYKWMPPEFIDADRNTFEQGSDVWSFGVMMWEIVTMGEEPFAGIGPQAAAIAILRGSRLPISDTCPEWLRKLILGCWMENPADRPSFKELYHMFKEILIRLLREQQLQQQMQQRQQPPASPLSSPNVRYPQQPYPAHAQFADRSLVQGDV